MEIINVYSSVKKITKFNVNVIIGKIGWLTFGEEKSSEKDEKIFAR